MKRITLRLDPATLPPLPWTAWPDKTGPKLVLWNGLNQAAIEIACESRAQALAFAALIEEIGRALEAAD